MDIAERLKAASREERDKAIIDARSAGWSIRQIVKAVGYSVGHVHRVITEHEENHR